MRADPPRITALIGREKIRYGIKAGVDRRRAE